MNLSRVCAVFAFLCFFLPQTCFAVTINEICWMGSKENSSDEWLELYNESSSPVSLDGWSIKSDDGKINIALKGSIPEKGYYLLERTDDQTVPTAKADLFYKGALNNKGQTLNLYDNFSNLQDSLDFKSGWPAGNNETKQTMERVDVKNWQTSQSPGGTPKAENSKPVLAQKKQQTEPVPAKETAPRQQEQKKTKYLAEASSPIKDKGAKVLPRTGIALTISAFSAILILLLKKNLKSIT
jgi:hypothetical protein